MGSLFVGGILPLVRGLADTATRTGSDFTYQGSARVRMIEAPYHAQYFFDYDPSGDAKLTYALETD